MKCTHVETVVDGTSIYDCTVAPEEDSVMYNKTVIFMEISRKFEPCFLN